MTARRYKFHIIELIISLTTHVIHSYHISQSFKGVTPVSIRSCDILSMCVQISRLIFVSSRPSIQLKWTRNTKTKRERKIKFMYNYTFWTIKDSKVKCRSRCYNNFLYYIQWQLPTDVNSALRCFNSWLLWSGWAIFNERNCQGLYDSGRTD